jgi:hypothetical protein
MAISKRLRYEVLRRDNHSCRYCGGSAPGVKLTVDHVLPVALGGSDEPSNLVTACADCNAGKSSSSPDAPLVADVAQDALRWSAAMNQAHAIARQSQAARNERRSSFAGLWNAWTYKQGPGQGEPVVLPEDWESSVDRLYDAGINDIEFDEAIRVAMASKARDVFRYMCGVAWRWVGDRQEIARQILDADGPVNGP